jgi:hypothetical protein
MKPGYDRWAHLGHILGECWVDYDQDVTYVHIPKCASSFIKGCLLSTLAFTRSDQLVKSNRYLVALRDPIDRWISGMAEYEFNSKQTNIDYQQITFDDHTETQDYFIQDIVIDKTDFFMVNDRLRANLKTWFNKFGYHVDVDNMKQYNASDLNIGKQQLKIKYQTIIDNDTKFVLKLKKHYANDYKLINSLRYYGT